MSKTSRIISDCIVTITCNGEDPKQMLWVGTSDGQIQTTFDKFCKMTDEQLAFLCRWAVPYETRLAEHQYQIHFQKAAYAYMYGSIEDKFKATSFLGAKRRLVAVGSSFWLDLLHVMGAYHWHFCSPPIYDPEHITFEELIEKREAIMFKGQRP